MKGFIIFEDFKKVINCKEILDGDYTCVISEYPNGMFSGIINRVTGAKCNKDDTYDFETGALIALMKMCGSDKVVRACNEAFSYEKDIEVLRKDNKNLREANKGMQEEIKRLKGESDNRWKNCQRNIQKKQVRINELQAQIKVSEDDKQKNVEYYEKEIKTLKEKFDKKVSDLRDQIHENSSFRKICEKLKEENKELHKNIDELFESDKHWKSEAGRLSFEKHRLEEKVEKLKLDCEMLQHGYNDFEYIGPCPADWDGDILNAIFLPCRACGKQYKALVELFKKLDQKKVDAAYKEAYNTTLPVWQKEALRQAYEIRKESKEKSELPKTLDINGTVYRKSIQIKDFGEQINKLTADEYIKQDIEFTQKCVDELIRPLTKREEMWEKIFELHKDNNVIIEVKREDVNAFLHELENKIPEITWASCVKIFETKYTIGDIYEELKRRNVIYFRLHKDNKLSYSSDPHIYPYRELKHIDYLPPMRWDLFKKGRLVVRLTKDNYKEFYEACEKELGRSPSYKPDEFAYCPIEKFVLRYNKKSKSYTFLASTESEKIVNWEDVR